MNKKILIILQVHAWSRAVSGLEGWIECFDKSHLAGVVFGGGVTNPGEINENHSAMKKSV